LADVPPAARRVSGDAGGLGQQWGEPLDPAVDRDVVDLDAAFGEQFFDVAVGQAVAQVPADRHQDRLGWEADPGERRARRRPRARPSNMVHRSSLPWIFRSANATDPQLTT